MASAKTHMNAHGGSTLRKATALKGSAGSGSQPIHDEPCTASADSISLVSLSDKEVSLLRTSVLRRPSEAGRHLCERSCEPVQCGKRGRDCGAGYIRPWHNSPMK